MKLVRNVLYGVAAVLFLALGFNAVTASQADMPTATASWAFNPTSMEELKGEATDIVVGKVVSVAKGEDIVIDNENEPTAQVIPTQEITLEVKNSFKGDKRAGETVTVFRTGDEDFAIEGDPAYVEGKTYVMFLRPQAGSDMSLVVAPAGRYSVENGKLNPVVHEGFGSEFKGMGIQEFVKNVK